MHNLLKGLFLRVVNKDFKKDLKEGRESRFKCYIG